MALEAAPRAANGSAELPRDPAAAREAPASPETGGTGEITLGASMPEPVMTATIARRPAALAARMARVCQVLEALQGPVVAFGGLVRAMGGMMTAAALLAVATLSLSAILRGEAKLKVTAPDGAYAVESPGSSELAPLSSTKPL